MGTRFILPPETTQKTAKYVKQQFQETSNETTKDSEQEADEKSPTNALAYCLREFLPCLREGPADFSS